MYEYKWVFFCKTIFLNAKRTSWIKTGKKIICQVTSASNKHLNALCQCKCRKYLVLWFSLTYIKNINLYWDLKFQYLYTIHIYICIHTCLLTSFHPNYYGFKVMFYLIESPSKNHSILPLDWASLMFQTVKEPA